MQPKFFENNQIKSLKLLESDFAEFKEVALPLARAPAPGSSSLLGGEETPN
jgi:hypothetical protein